MKKNKRKIMKKMSQFSLALIILTLSSPLISNGIEIKAKETNDIYTGGKIVEKNNFDATKTNQNISIVTSTPKINSTIKEQSTKEQSKINISKYKDESKISKNAGNNILQVNKNLEGEYNIQKNGELNVKKQNNSSDLNSITVNNGRIVAADSAIVSTIGGYDYTAYMYPTLEDAYNKSSNGTTVSGGAFDGTYLKTEKYNEQYFVKLIIGGYEGYMSINDVQIIPEDYIKAQSYYVNEDGKWNFYEAIDPLNSNEYRPMTVDDAPDWAKEDTKYFTNNDQDFYTSNLINLASKNTSTTNYSYFQNLPFRSTSNYTGEQYKNFLKYKEHTNSKYYNYTNAFTEAQDKSFINSLFLFSMANHEGAYGTSDYSNKCNNFFGRGAIDSDPDQACEKYGFTTARDGILAQGIFLTQNYADVDWWGFHGTELGDKSHGLNVSYASDVNWGKNISSLMYETDQYLKGNENNYYRIYEIKNSEPYYTSSALSDKVYKKPQGQSQKEYWITRNEGKNPRIVVTATKSTSFEAQISMPKNLKGESYCTWTDANNGSYPNYDGVFGGSGTSYANPVNKNISNFACDYQNWSQQQEWYANKDASGNITYNIVNDVPAKEQISEEDISTYYTYWDNGDVKTKTIEKKEGSTLIDKTEYSYSDKEGTQVDYVHQMYALSGKRIYYRHLINEPNGNLTYDCMITYIDSGNKTGIKKRYYQKTFDKNNHLIDFYDRKYADNNQITDYLHEMYASSGERTYYRHLIYEFNGNTTYDCMITYIDSGSKIGIKKRYYQKTYDKNNHLIDFYDRKYADNNQIIDYLHEMHASSGKRTYYRHLIYESNGNTTYDCMITYINSGSKTGIKKRYYQKWYSNGKIYHYLDRYYYDNNVMSKNLDKQYSVETGKETSFIEIRYDRYGNQTYYHKN